MTTKHKSNRNIIRGTYKKESEPSQTAKAIARMSRINQLMRPNMSPVSVKLLDVGGE